MYKQLLEPHFLLILFMMLIVALGWLFGRAPTETAVPLLVSLALGGAGLSAYQRGVSTGVPLSQAGPPPGEQVRP